MSGWPALGIGLATLFVGFFAPQVSRLVMLASRDARIDQARADDTMYAIMDYNVQVQTAYSALVLLIAQAVLLWASTPERSEPLRNVTATAAITAFVWLNVLFFALAPVAIPLDIYIRHGRKWYPPLQSLLTWTRVLVALVGLGFVAVQLIWPSPAT